MNNSENISEAKNQHNNTNKKSIIFAYRILPWVLILITLFTVAYIVIPDIINVPVQKGYKATYETVEENFKDHNAFKINIAYCYRTKRLETKSILDSYTSKVDNNFNITHIYKYNIESEQTLGLKINVYCGYNSKTGEVIFFGTDGTYYELEHNNATTGEFGNYRKVINSKLLSDIIEFIY